ncbi:MAG: amidohydrolase family protein [Oscillospiraceae bacterium]|nr:amidohydrolase family protein [Oscillospiraceae bacterium]
MNWEQYIFEGKPFEGIYIFDVHGHVGAHKPFQLGGYDADSVAKTCRRMNVDGVVVSSLPALASDWKWGNEEVAASVDAYPGLIWGYASPNPFYEDCDITPYLDLPGFVGVKIHGDMQGSTPVNDPRYFPTYEVANERGLPVLFHAWLSAEVRAAADVARRYPNTKIILGHSGMTARDTALEVARTCDNIFIDTAISSTYDNAIEVLVDKVGADRVVYGSDICFFDCIHTMGKIALARISDTDKEKIFGLNARGLFSL